jgi:membrane-associated phospholipid phosphatase
MNFAKGCVQMRITPLPSMVLVLCVLAILPMQTRAQSVESIPEAPQHQVDGNNAAKPRKDPTPATCGYSHLVRCLKDLGQDQISVWTSPLRAQPVDAIWLIPFGAATGVAIYYDPQAQQGLGINLNRINASKTVSQFGSPYATFGAAAGIYLFGIAKHNEHLAETGRLGAEAVLDASIVAEGIKLATNRERPYQGLGQGGFWPHGTSSFTVDGSFPSGHAAASWALARVIASQYPSRPIQIGAYAFALAISASRVTAREHFPSDVLVGATFGYLIGGYVLHHHALEYQDFSVSLLPIMDSASRTYGLRLDIVP